MSKSVASALPSYADAHALPVALRLKGSVVKGFGRGSKELGIPTANLDADLLGDALSGAPAGVYCGWASVGPSAEVFKMATSIGWCVRLYALFSLTFIARCIPRCACAAQSRNGACTKLQRVSECMPSRQGLFAHVAEPAPPTHHPAAPRSISFRDRIAASSVHS